MLNSSAPSIILRPPSSQNVLSHGDVNQQSSYGPRQNNHERIEPTSYLTRFVQTRCFLFSKNLKNQNARQKNTFQCVVGEIQANKRQCTSSQDHAWRYPMKWHWNPSWLELISEWAEKTHTRLLKGLKLWLCVLIHGWILHICIRHRPRRHHGTRDQGIGSNHPSILTHRRLRHLGRKNLVVVVEGVVVRIHIIIIRVIQEGQRLEGLRISGVRRRHRVRVVVVVVVRQHVPVLPIVKRAEEIPNNRYHAHFDSLKNFQIEKSMWFRWCSWADSQKQSRSGACQRSSCRGTLRRWGKTERLTHHSKWIHRVGSGMHIISVWQQLRDLVGLDRQS